VLFAFRQNGEGKRVIRPRLGQTGGLGRFLGLALTLAFPSKPRQAAGFLTAPDLRHGNSSFLRNIIAFQIASAHLPCVCA